MCGSVHILFCSVRGASFQVLAEEHCGELDAERRKQETEEGFEDEVDNSQAAQAVELEFAGDSNAKILHMLTNLTASNEAILERLGAVEAAVGIGK